MLVNIIWDLQSKSNSLWILKIFCLTLLFRAAILRWLLESSLSNTTCFYEVIQTLKATLAGTILKWTIKIYWELFSSIFVISEKLKLSTTRVWSHMCFRHPNKVIRVSIHQKNGARIKPMMCAWCNDIVGMDLKKRLFNYNSSTTSKSLTLMFILPMEFLTHILS